MYRDNIRYAICFLIDERENGSPAAFGKRIGRIRQRVNSWKKGESVPDLETLDVIAGVYGVSFDWLIGGDGDSAPDGFTEYRFVNFRDGCDG